MDFFNTESIRKYSLITVMLLLATILACGIAGISNAQVSVVSSGGSLAVTGPGGSFVSSGTPYIAGGAPYNAGGFAQERMVCYQNDAYGTLVCYRAPPNVFDYTGGGIYRTPGTVVIQSGSFA
jgi:hypothetical protein